MKKSKWPLLWNWDAIDDTEEQKWLVTQGYWISEASMPSFDGSIFYRGIMGEKHSMMMLPFRRSKGESIRYFVVKEPRSGSRRSTCRTKNRILSPPSLQLYHFFLLILFSRFFFLVLSHPDSSLLSFSLISILLNPERWTL